MIDPNTLLNLYDFSLVEDAFQEALVAIDSCSFVKPPDSDDPNREKWVPAAGDIPVYTPSQALVFQQSRPRVGMLETNFVELPGQRIVDVDGNIRASGWRGIIKLAIITDCNYTLHRELRALILAILPQLQPNLTQGLAGVGESGINKYLEYHEVGQFALQSGDTNITPQTGYYFSTLPIEFTFSVRATAWPGGTITP